MKTYLIFFGKSQDFKSVYFNAESKIENFDTVIKDFDLLESNIFTVDDINNGEIFSKYFFEYRNKKYSLLKLYSFAQATNGSRISGSIFGVGLLSEKNINLSKSNLNLLKVAKYNFEKLSVSNKKFNKSNFDVDVEKIWKAIINNNGQNLLNLVDYNNYPKEIKPKSIGVKLDFYESIESIDKHEILFNKVYFSSDLEHLKRTQLKWDKSKFPIFFVDNGTLKEYKEKIVEPSTDKRKEYSNKNIIGLKLDYDDLKQKHNELTNDFNNLSNNSKKRELFFKSIIIFLFASITFLIFYYSFFLNEQVLTPVKPVKVKQSRPQKKIINSTENLRFNSSYKEECDKEDSIKNTVKSNNMEKNNEIKPTIYD